ncbi:MAG: hypothetical protein JWL74_1460 [Alphaproteobacteria bacterium]|nr:hypothetical protein [Alphaproteobacteria bacterium]
MTTQPEFFRAQAATMHEQAQAAVLDNVRDRCLRSAAAWTEMAERSERHRRSLASTEAAKAQAASLPPA